MKSGIKKLAHNFLAMAVSVCMVCTLTPSAAWANSGSSDQGGFAGADDGTASASSTVTASVRNANFRFNYITPAQNYKTKDDFVKAITGGQPLQATMLEDGLPDSYTVEWFIQEFRPNSEFDSSQPESKDNPKIIYVDQEATMIFSEQYTKGDTPTTDQDRTFEYPTRGNDGVIVAPSALSMDDNKRYEFSILMTDDNGPETHASTQVTLLNDYPEQIVVSEDYPEVSVKGDIYQDFTIPPAVSAVEVADVPATDEVFQKIKEEALKHTPVSETIEEALQIQLVNNAKPEGENPYEGTLEVTIPLPDSLKNAEPAPKEGDKYTVYVADEDGEITVKTGEVTWAVDESGNPIEGEDGQRVPVVAVEVSGTGVNLGTFAVGIPVGGTYNMTTLAGAGAQFSPACDNTKMPLGSATLFSSYAIAPYYRFDNYTLTVDGVSKSIDGNDVGYNNVSLVPSKYGINENSDVVLTANYTSVTPGSYTNKLNASLLTDSGAGGSYTVSTVFVEGTKNGAGTEVTQQGNKLNNEPVTTSRSISGVDIDRGAGLLLQFEPNKSSYVKSVVINDKEASFQGNTLMLGTMKENLSIVVTYGSGSQPSVGTNTVSVEVQKRPNGALPATLQSDEGAVTGNAEYEATTGGSVTIKAQPYKDFYGLDKVLVYSPAYSDKPTDIVKHVYVSPNNSETNYPPDSIQLYNVIADSRVVLVYKILPAYVDVEVPDGVDWGWIPGGDAYVDPYETPGGGRSVATFSLFSTYAAAAPSAAGASTGSRLSTTVQYGTLNLTKEGDYARLVVYDRPGYELGDIVVNGNRVNSLLTKHVDGKRTYYSLVVYLGETGTAPSGIGVVADDPGNPDKIFYTSANNVRVNMTFNPSVIPAPSFNVITTSVTNFGGGTITPSRNVEEGGEATIEFFPDDGYKVEYVWLDGNILNEPEEDWITFPSDHLSLKLTNVTNSYTVQVSFTPGTQANGDKARHTVTATAGMGGSINPAGTFPVYEGTTQQFVLAPSTGYQVSQVKVDGKVVSDNDARLSGNTLEIASINKDVDVQVTFRKIDSSSSATYTVTPTKTGNGRISPSGAVIVGAGADATFAMIPEEGYYVQDVRVFYADNGTSDGISLISLYDRSTFTFTLSDVREDATVRAVFAEGTEDGKIPGTNEDMPTPPGAGDIITIDPGNLTINPQGAPGAMVSPSPSDIDIVKEDGTNHGTTAQTFTVTVMDGYELNSPIKGSGIVVKDGTTNVTEKVDVNEVGNGVYTVTVPKEHVTSDLKIEVSTHPKESSTESVTLKKVTLSAAGDGYITPGMQKVGDETATIQLENGKNQTFNFLAADGWKLFTVYVNGKPTTVTNNVLTIHGIQQDTTIEAVFSKLENGETVTKPVTREVTILQGAHGEVSPMGKVTVIDGSSLTISAKPNEGYKTVAKIDGANVAVIGNSVGIDKVTKPMTVNIDFVQSVSTQYRTLTIDSEGPGTTSPSGMSLVTDDSSQTITFIPDTGKKVKSVTVNGEDRTTSVNRTTLSLTIDNITENTVVKAVFCNPDELSPTSPGYNLPPTGTTITYYNVTTSTPKGGGMVSPPAAQVARGGSVELTVMPNNGYELDTLFVNGVDRKNQVKNSVLSLQNVTADTAVEVNFKKSTAANLEDFYTVFISATGNGSVSPAGAITVAAGGSQSITIMPDPDYKVRDILVNDVSSGKNFTGSSYTLFNITEDKNVIVTFEKGAGGASVMTHEVFATSTLNGKVSPEGTTKVADGKNASFSFVPNAGYKLSYVTIDGADIPAQYIINNQYIFTDVRENHTLHAVFVPSGTTVDDYVTVAVGRCLNGTISPSDSVIVPLYGNQEFIITPFYGYKVSDILVNGSSIGKSSVSSGASISNNKLTYANGVLNLLNLSDDATVSAEFVKTLVYPEEGSPTYVPVNGSTSGTGGAGGTTSIGGGGYFEEPGSDATGPEKKPQITITPDPGSMIDKVEIKYGDGSKTVIDDDGVYEYDSNGNLVDKDGDPVDATTGGKAQLGEDGKPINPIKYPAQGSGSNKYPTDVTPTTQTIYEQGYVEIDGEKAAETGGVNVDVTFRPQTESEKQQIANGSIKQPTYYEINATYSGGGRVFPEGHVKVADGQNMVFQMIPSAGYEVASLTADNRDEMNSLTSSRKFIFKNVKGNHTLNAVFGFVTSEMVHYDVTASSNVDGGVSPLFVSVPQGSDSIVYFFPPAGQKVANVTVKENGTEILNDSNYVQHMYVATNIKGKIDVIVTYEAAGPDDQTWTVTPVKVTSSTPGNGKVSPSEATVPAGSPQTFFFEPEPGYVVDYVIFNDVATTLKDNPASFAVTPSAGAENNLAVYFREATAKDKQFTTIMPTLTPGSNATISPSSMNVEVGSSVKFYISPAAGQTLKTVKVDGWDVAFKPALPAGQAAQNGAVYTMYEVTIDNVQPGMKVEVETTSTDQTPIQIATHTMTVTGENAMYTPMGNVKLPQGAEQLIKVDPLPGYYLDSIMVTDYDSSGNPVGEPIDMTDRLKANEITVPMGQYDRKVYIKYLLVGSGSEQATPAYVAVGTTKTDMGRDVTASIGLARTEDGTVVPLTVDPVTRKLLDTNGEPYPFERGGNCTFYVTADPVDGKALTLSSATYNGNAQTVPNLTGMIANMKINASGTLDLVFRELKEGEKPIVTQEYNVKFVVSGGNGTIEPEYAIDPGFTVQMGSSSNPVAMKPANDNWMIGSVIEKRFDKNGDQLGSDVVVDPRKYKNETYVCTPMSDTIVYVEFVECAIVDVKWEKSLGFVAPNPSGQYLKIPVDQAGEPFQFIVAPFEDCYVDRFDVTPKDGETVSYITQLTQSQAVVDYLTSGGYNVKDFTEGGSVTSPSGAAAAAPEGGISAFAVQAKDLSALDLNPIDYNGFVPDKGTTMQNGYGVQTYLHPTMSTVDIGLYTTKQSAQRYTITPVLNGSGGRILPDTPQIVMGGGKQTFNFIANNGYSVKRVLVDGNPITAGQLGSNGTSYEFVDVDRDHTITVEFGPITSDASSRLIRVASSLARTGDLTGPAIGALLIVAACGLMVTAISYIRRQQRRRRRMQGMQ